MLPVNPHPPIVMFASTFGITCVIFELLSVRSPVVFTRQIRFVLLTLFLGACIASYYSGFYGADFASSVSEELIKSHQGYARFGLILLLATFFLGSVALVSEYSTPRILWFYRGSLMIVAGIIIYTSHLGGELVFQHGGGVKGVGYKEKSGLEQVPTLSK